MKSERRKNNNFIKNWEEKNYNHKFKKLIKKKCKVFNGDSAKKSKY